MRKGEWYFDVVSPFASLCRARLAQLGSDVEVVYRPVLLAGLGRTRSDESPAVAIAAIAYSLAGIGAACQTIAPVLHFNTWLP
jgi:2-hydroxychromene-2-carboxylate isomerase